MDKTVSVSKGCFVHKPKSFSSKKPKKQQPFGGNQPWCKAYKKLWSSVEENLEELREELFSKIFENLILYVQNCHTNKVQSNSANEIPSATLLTGVNLPDHDALFATLSSQLHEKVTPHVATLQQRHCTTIRSTVEHLVHQFMFRENRDSSLEVEEFTEEVVGNIKKNQCNFPTLSAWYNEQVRIKPKSPVKSPRKKVRNNQNAQGASSPILVVVIPNVEEFSSQILQNIILIASGYVKTLPLVFVFGVATAVCALHRSLPYDVSSKLCNKVFNSEPSITHLNQVIEKVFLTEKCPFHLDDRTFKLLTDIFLFYDFSVHGFIQHFKYCMIEHFFNSNSKVLCCSLADLPQSIKSLDEQQLEELRQLPSFRQYVDTLPKKDKAPLLVDNSHFKAALQKLMTDLHEYLQNFHAMLRCLYVLTSSLPKAPLGKHLREVYSTAVAADVAETPQFKECFQLLGFLSREELLDKLGRMLSILQDTIKDEAGKCSPLREVEQELAGYHTKVMEMGLKTAALGLKSPSKIDIGANNRHQLKEKLLELSRKQKPLSAYEETRKSLLDYLTGTVFSKFLIPPAKVPLHEVLFFNNMVRVKKNIMGTPRAAVHMALNNPSYYLQCECCKSATVSSSLPDVCLVYKLHLECGRLVNLYDWLQAFLAVTNPSELGDEQTQVPPDMQARFTRAVAELQFLGFIKTSKKKTDHVTRLTWGPS